MRNVAKILIFDKVGPVTESKLRKITIFGTLKVPKVRRRSKVGIFTILTSKGGREETTEKIRSEKDQGKVEKYGLKVRGVVDL